MRDQSEYLDLSPIKRCVAKCHEVKNVWRYEEWPGNLRMSRATGTVPERVQSRVHTTEPTGPVPEPFHCDHIARWSARSGTTGRSGTGVNTGARLRSGTVPVPKLWCEHGHVVKRVFIMIIVGSLILFTCRRTSIVWYYNQYHNRGYALTSRLPASTESPPCWRYQFNNHASRCMGCFDA